MFEIKNVSKQYKSEFALYNVSMNINKGLNFIVGSSGSGKTTLLKIMSGMEQDFDGEVLYCGKNIKDLSANEKSYFYNNIFGFVWQDFNLIEDATVLDNVLLSEYLKGEKI
ncbi:ATP-binding cassette domain-containing protein [Bacillus cereus]